ncbi:hypothetical protein EVAR_27965_1 [Eumeta japonica]|uniref:Uncharacterized protein n=1 Tax=Eumeta variegata TaxID=151549 RepID=A0A4C1WCF3_EUMVA|nr:hypothetical protein EVAR_27965_1 [Eumeta japonica]
MSLHHDSNAALKVTLHGGSMFAMETFLHYPSTAPSLQSIILVRRRSCEIVNRPAKQKRAVKLSIRVRPVRHTTCEIPPSHKTQTKAIASAETFRLASESYDGPLFLDQPPSFSISHSLLSRYPIPIQEPGNTLMTAALELRMSMDGGAHLLFKVINI